MKLALSLKSPVPNEAIMVLQQSIADWQADNPDFKEELYQATTFYIIQTLIDFDLLIFKIWLAGKDIQENQYSLTHILEPLPWTLQAVRDNQDFEWLFYHHSKHTRLVFTYQATGSYLLTLYSTNIENENLTEPLSKQELIKILTHLKLTFETYIKHHFSSILPKNYLPMFDNFYNLTW